MNRIARCLSSMRLSLPPAPVLLLALALAYTLPGLLGHDPWKTEDAIGTGIVHQMLRHGEWLVPNVAGEPFLEDGPLYYWVAAGFAWVSSPVLELHNGARLASAALMLLVLVLLRMAARELYGKPEGDAAALVPALIAALVPLLCRDWRTRQYAATLALAAAAGAAICGAWLLEAQMHAPGALGAWLAYQMKALAVPTGAALADYAVTLSWAAWPAWPIALWLLWERRARLAETGTAYPLAALVVTAAVVAMTHGNRDVTSLPLLLPLALLAGAGVPLLRRGAANALAWFGAMTFSFFGALVWLGWIPMVTGVPGQIQRNFAKLEPGHVPQFQWFGFTAAAAFTLAWLFILLRSERSAFRSITFWSAGVALLWSLIMTLWIDWIDYGRSYRPVALALKRALPTGSRCIESRGLGEAQRAAFDYHVGVLTRRAEAAGA